MTQEKAGPDAHPHVYENPVAADGSAMFNDPICLECGQHPTGRIRRYVEPGVEMPYSMTIKDMRVLISDLGGLGAVDLRIAGDFRLAFTVDAEDDWTLRGLMEGIAGRMPSGSRWRGDDPDKIEDVLL